MYKWRILGTKRVDLASLLLHVHIMTIDTTPKACVSAATIRLEGLIEHSNVHIRIVTFTLGVCASNATLTGITNQEKMSSSSKKM